MSPVRLNGSTSGYTELSAPAVAGSNTLTLPTGNGTSGQVLSTNGSGALSWIGAGKILQVVQATYSVETGSSSSTYADTGLSKAITISSGSSVLAIVSHGSIFKTSGSVSTRMNLKLVRGSTDLSVWGVSLLYTNSSMQNCESSSFAYLDVPGSAGTYTYKTQFSSPGNDATVYVQANSGMSSIILLEVAA